MVFKPWLGSPSGFSAKILIGHKGIFKSMLSDFKYVGMNVTTTLTKALSRARHCFYDLAEKNAYLNSDC